MKIKRIILLVIIVLFVTGCGCSNKEMSDSQVKKLEKQMTTYIDSYYSKNIKNYITGITEQKITIKQLKDMSYDTSKLVNYASDELCTESSYALVKIEDPTNLKTSKYTIENHLTCGDYKTKN